VNILLHDVEFEWDGEKYGPGKAKYFEPYSGSVAEAKGATSSSEVVATGPWESQVPYINQLFNEAGKLYNNGPPSYYPDSTVAAPNPTVTGSQNAITGYIGAQQPVNAGMLQGAARVGDNSFANPAYQTGMIGATAAGQALPNMTGGVNVSGELNKSLGGGAMNPYLEQLVAGATRTAGRQFNDTVLPGIRQDATLAGQRGGVSEGIAQGIAAGRMGETIGDVTTSLYGNAFDRAQAERVSALGTAAQREGAGAQLGVQAGLGGQQGAVDQYLRSLQAMAGVQGNQLGQYQMGNTVGLQQQGFQQAQLDNQVARYNWQQMAPYNALSQYQSYITGAYGSSLPGQTPQNSLPGQNPTNGGGLQYQLPPMDWTKIYPRQT
jgi:hypothetical protein